MARSMVNQGLLLQREVTPGTPLVTAMQQYLGIRATPGWSVEGEDFKASGYKVNTSRVPNTETGTASVDTIQDYNAMTPVLTGAYGAPVSALVPTAIAAYQHEYELKPKAADTLVSFTAMWGDGTQALQLPYFVFNNLGLQVQRGQLALTTGAMSYAPVTGVVMPTVGIVEVGSVPLAGRTWDVFCDDTWGDLGTTKLLACYEANATFGDKYVPDYVINSAKPSFDSLLEGEDTDYSANFRFGFDATAIGLISTFTSGALKFIRLKSTGAEIETGFNYSAQFDFCVRITAPGEISSAPNSPAVSLPFDCQITVDPDTGNASQAVLVNDVATL